MQQRGSGSLSRAADDGDKDGLEEQERQPGEEGGNNQPPLSQHREDNEIQGEQKGDGFKGNASRPERGDPTAGEKFYSAMREKQGKKNEQETAGMEAPGQQKSSSENGVVVKIDGRGRYGPECALENHGSGKQEYAPRQYQRLERS